MNARKSRTQTRRAGGRDEPAMVIFEQDSAHSNIQQNSRNRWHKTEEGETWEMIYEGTT